MGKTQFCINTCPISGKAPQIANNVKNVVVTLMTKSAPTETRIAFPPKNVSAPVTYVIWTYGIIDKKWQFRRMDQSGNRKMYPYPVKYQNVLNDVAEDIANSYQIQYLTNRRFDRQSNEDCSACAFTVVDCAQQCKQAQQRCPPLIACPVCADPITGKCPEKDLYTQGKCPACKPISPVTPPLPPPPPSSQPEPFTPPDDPSTPPSDPPALPPAAPHHKRPPVAPPIQPVPVPVPSPGSGEPMDTGGDDDRPSIPGLPPAHTDRPATHDPVQPIDPVAPKPPVAPPAPTAPGFFQSRTFWILLIVMLVLALAGFLFYTLA